MLALGFEVCSRLQKRRIAMPLSDSLRSLNLTFNCPHCDYALVKKGVWFQTVRGFKCEGCQRMLRLTYDDKVALFDKHAHLS